MGRKKIEPPKKRRKKVALSEFQANVNLRSSSIAVHVCPAAKIEYYGNCPNTSCPANLARLTSSKESGCFHEKYPLSLDGFQHIINVSKKDMKEVYRLSMLQLEKMIKFFHLLPDLRAETRHTNFCMKCGAPIVSKFKTCANPINCSERQELTEKVLSQPPLNLNGLEIYKSDLWLLVEYNTFSYLRYNYGLYLTTRLWSRAPRTINPVFGDD